MLCARIFLLTVAQRIFFQQSNARARTKRTLRSKMKKIADLPLVAFLVTGSLLLSLVVGPLLGRDAFAQSGTQRVKQNAAGLKALRTYATDLTAQARQGRLEPVNPHDAAFNR